MKQQAIHGWMRAATLTGVLLAAACGADDDDGVLAGSFASPVVMGGTTATAGVMAMPGPAGAQATAGATPTAGTTAPMAGTTAPMAGTTAPPAGAGGMAGAADPAGSGGAAPSGPKLLPTTDVTMDGPYMTMVDMNADGGAAWIFRPTELGKDGVKHPFLVWGCGSGSLPSQYMFHLSRIASHGFVVYAADSSSVTGALLTKGLDFMFAENERSGGDFHQKLDTMKVSVGGHSLGSLSTYEIASDPRITNTIHVDGGQFDGMGGQRLKKPAIFICGDNSIGKPNCDADYMGSMVPVFYTQLEGLDGLDGHIQAARQGIDIWVAWMRWTLAGEEERRKDFLDPNCIFCMGKYMSMHKNFM